MRTFIAVVVVAVSGAAWGGPIAEQFASGYAGVTWGMPLAVVVGMMPNGDHSFATPTGTRGYTVRSDEPLLGVPRSGKLMFHFGKAGGVDTFCIGVPYERRDQLLSALTLQLGNYARKGDVGNETIYFWKDQDFSVYLEILNDSRYGIAQVAISHPRDASSAASAK